MQALVDHIGRDFDRGCMEFATADGRAWTLGRGAPRVRLRLRDSAVLRRMLMNPALHFGEAWMDGDWVPEGCTLREVLAVGIQVAAHVERRLRWPALRRLRALLGERNTPLRAQHNAAHHYNVDYQVYRRFLDADLHYSCAYFAEPGMSLEAAQQAKCRLIARKLDLKPGATVLDIGCGWGSLAMYLAEHHDVCVTGITLSQSQLDVARQRAQARGLDGRVQFRLEDYRRTSGSFDAIVSVGMFEHVGRPQYRTFFSRIARLLQRDGTALLHTIGRSTSPGFGNPWIGKYIFPGGYIPAASEMLPAIESSRLVLCDLEVWRRHYALTLAEWQRRFEAASADLPPQFDERFRRMWNFYLLASEASFVHGDLVVFQIQMAHRNDRLPLTRDYLYL